MMKKKMMKRILSVVLALTMTFSGLYIDGIKAYADVSEGEIQSEAIETETSEETEVFGEENYSVPETPDVSANDETGEPIEELFEDSKDASDEQGKYVEASIELPAGTYVDYAGGKALEATITWYSDSGYGYGERLTSETVVIPEYDNRGSSKGTSVAYRCHYSSDKNLKEDCYVQVSFSSSSFEGNSNLLAAGSDAYYYYMDGNGAKWDYYPYTYDIKFASRITLPIASVYGTLSLPEGVPAPDGKIYYQVMVGDSYTYRTSLTIPAGAEYVSYQIPKYDKDEADYFIMGYDYAPSAASGLYTGWCYYDPQTGKLVQSLSLADAKAKASGFSVDKFKNGLDVTIPKASTTLTLTLPEGFDELEEEEYEGTAYAYYADEKGYEIKTQSPFSFTTKETGEIVVYLNQVPDCAEELNKLLLPFGTSSGTGKLLVNSESSYYYSGNCLAFDGEKLIYCNGSEAPMLDISEEKSFEAELLPTPVVCNVTAPEGTDFNGDEYLFGSIKIYYKDTEGASEKYVEKNYTLYPEDVETGVKVYFNNLSPNIYSVERIEYKDNHYSYPNANIAQCQLYYTASGPVSTKENAGKPSYEKGKMNEYETPLALAAIKVNIHHNPDVVFIDGVEDYEREFSYTVNSEIKTGSYSSDAYSSSSGNKCLPEEDTVRYIVDWPIDELNVPYVALKAGGVAYLTNMVTNSYEYITATGITSDKSEALSYTRTDRNDVLEVDVTPAVTNMHGEFALDDDVILNGGNLTLWANYKTNKSTSEQYVTRSFSPENRSFECFFNREIPCDATSISKLYFNFKESSSYVHTETNLMLEKNIYLAETPIDSETGEMRYQRGETGTSLPIPTDGSTIVFPVHKAEAVIPVNISLPEGAQVIGSSFIGKITAQYTENYKDKVTASFEILPGETTATTYIGLPGEITSIEKLEYECSSGQKCANNIKTGYATYTADGWKITRTSQSKTPAKYELLTDWDGKNPHIDIELFKARSIYGTISMPEGVYVDDKVNVEVGVEAIGPAESYSEGTSCNLVFDKGEKTADYLLSIPDDAEKITQFYVKVDLGMNYGCSNVLEMNYFLTDGGTFVANDDYSYSCEYALDGTDDVKMDVTLQQTKSLKGTIIMPDDAFIEGDEDAYVELTLKIDASEKANGSYISNYDLQRTYILKPTDKLKSFKYELPIDVDTALIKNISAHAIARNGARTNLFDNGGFAMRLNNKISYGKYDNTKGEISWEQNDELKLETPETVNDFDIAWYTSKVIKGTITFTDDCFSDEVTSAELALVGYTSQYGSYTEYARSPRIEFDLNRSHTYEYWYLAQPDIVRVKCFDIDFNGTTDGSKTNVYWGTCSYGENGSCVSREEIASSDIPFDKAVNEVNWTIKPSPVVSGSFTLPENVTYKSSTRGYGLSAELGFYQENSQDRYAIGYDYDDSIDELYEGVPNVDMTFADGARTASYSLVLRPECKKVNYIKFKLGKQVSDVTTNADTDTIHYLGVNGEWGTCPEDITPYDITGNFTFGPMFPTPKTLRGRITLCEGGYFTGSDISVKIDPVIKGKKGDYTQTYELAPTRNYADYTIEIPAAVGRIDYIEVTAKAKGTSIDTNLYLDKTMYQGGGDTLLADKENISPITFAEATLTKNIFLECFKVIKGMVSLPEDALADGSVSGKVYVEIGSTKAESNEFTLNSTTESTNYSIKLPAGTDSVSNMYVDLTSEGKTFLRDGKSYYNADISNATGKWYSNSVKAEGFAVTGGNTEVNLELPLSVEINGTISIPENAVFDDGLIRGYVETDCELLGNMGSCEFVLTPEERTASYTIMLPVETTSSGNLKIHAIADSDETDGETNLFLGADLYLGTSGWLYSKTGSKTYNFTTVKAVTENLSFPIANKVKGVVRRQDRDGFVTTNVIAENNGHTEVAMVRFEDGKDEVSYSISFLPSGDSTFVLGYEMPEEQDGYVRGPVYIGENGKYYLNKDFAADMEFGTDTNEIILALWSDFDEDVLFESLHPYTDDTDYSLSYTYPGTATSLKISFTENTCIDESDSIEILTAEGNHWNSYSGFELSGKTITVNSTGFTIVIHADETGNSYGFGIASIEAVNGSINKNLAASIVYENGTEPLYAVIINTTDKDATVCLNTTGYNTAGRMVFIIPVKLTVSSGMQSVMLDGYVSPLATKTKYILYDSSLTPLFKSIP